MMRKWIVLIAFLFLSCLAIPCLHADLDSKIPGLHEFIKSTIPKDSAVTSDSFLSFKNQLKIIAFLTLISLIPFGIMMLTSFTRLMIVFQFLRQALGFAQVPSNQIIIGLSLLLTGYVMHPVIEQIYAQAFTPYLNGDFKKMPGIQLNQETEEAVFFQKAWIPLRTFLLQHIREKDLALFTDISQFHVSQTTNTNLIPTLESTSGIDLDAVPWYCIIPAFLLSELRVAFMMGFLLFLPFLIIDMVVAAVLMSMGMMMLPPMMVSTPFKLLLFIMVDGWQIIVYQLVKGF